jgi:hypothetical protein
MDSKIPQRNHHASIRSACRGIICINSIRGGDFPRRRVPAARAVC